jgi:hypothetical protein
MIWGYGRVGYGPFRTARVLTENSEAATTLQDAGSELHEHGGPAAFEWLAGHHLHGLGVSFATKYLFFVDSANLEPALILDRLVRSWLGQNTGWYPRLDWRTADYRRYIDTALSWAAELETTPDDIEYLMFAGEAESDPASQWKPSFATQVLTVPPAAPSLLSPEETGVLDALDDAAEAFSELPDVPASDSEDFERGIRQLRRVVLSRGRLRS